VLYPIRYSIVALTELNYNTKTVKIMDKMEMLNKQSTETVGQIALLKL
jgi:hypothetical protein